MKFDMVSQPEVLDDAHLVGLCLEGKREAFGQLVARYQSPVCAFAYSACGDIAQSEDLAQETFLIAWRKLSDLREPAKFKSWLFGIARNLLNNDRRRETRNPLAAAEPLDDNLTAVAASSPSDHAIGKEEQQILWNSLANIPETYREPLILFYREQQSIERVAAALDLSEEAARQRLSRGRKLLREQMAAFVEGALAQTAPGAAFTMGVMAALPGITITAVTTGASTTAKGGAAGKAIASAGLFSILFGPILWFCGAVASTWAMAVKLPDSSRERKHACISMAVLWTGWVAYVVGVFLFTRTVDWKAHAQRNTALLLASSVGFIVFLSVFFAVAGRAQRRIRNEEWKRPGNTSYFARFECFEYRSARTLLGLPLVHVRMNRDMTGPPAKGWIAIGTKAYGLVFAAGAIAIAPISWGAYAFGGLALGGFGVGIVAFGGAALGIGAMGGVAIGYLACGGGAIGWLGATGGATMARHFASGGDGAIAQHANDHAAELFMRQSLFFHYAWPFIYVMITVSWLAPLVGLWFKRWLNRRYPA